MAGIDDVELSDEQLRSARHGYYAAISYVDERIGSVLGALRATGLEENTIVVFTADHGEFLGERGLWYKMSFLEPSARVPLIVRLPNGPAATRISQPVSLLDLAPTAVELLLGVKAGSDFDGESFASLIRERPAPERRPVICEYHAEGVNAPAAMIRDGRYKLIVCGDDPDLLYDLEADPCELTDLAARPECEGLVSSLRAALAERLDLTEIERRVLASQRERHLVARALAEGEFAAWDYQPVVDASMRYVRSRSDLYELQRHARLESP
jgi:choline-sulfatase